MQVEDLEKAAKKHDAVAQYKLGKIYYEGKKGLPKDNKVALDLIAESYIQGYRPAKFLLDKIIDDESSIDSYKDSSRRYKEIANTAEKNGNFDVAKNFNKLSKKYDRRARLGELGFAIKSGNSLVRFYKQYDAEIWLIFSGALMLFGLFAPL